MSDSGKFNTKAGITGILNRVFNFTKNRLRTEIVIGNTQNLDAFGRLRTSNPIDVFDHKNISSRLADFFDEVLVGSGAINFIRQTSTVQLSVTGTDGDRSLRQTRYMTYIPGKSQHIDLSGVICEDKDAWTMSVVRRTSTSGSAVDVKVDQEDWNVDKLDGSGDAGNPSSYEFISDKGNLFHIDFQWLGVGRVRMAVLSPDGETLDAHHFENTGIDDKPYMRTPSLPMRFEIIVDATTMYSRIGYFDDNDGLFFEARRPITAGTFTLKEGCFTCSNEAGGRPSGLEYHSNTRGKQSVASNAGADVLAVRLLNSFQGHENRRTSVLFATQFFANSENTIFEIYKVTSYTDTGTSWTSVNTHSGCEYSAGTDLSLTITHDHQIACAVVAANASGSKADSGQVGISSPFEILDENRIIKQNYDSTKSQLFLIKAFTINTGTTTNVGSAFTWFEIE